MLAYKRTLVAPLLQAKLEHNIIKLSGGLGNDPPRINFINTVNV